MASVLGLVLLGTGVGCQSPRAKATAPERRAEAATASRIEALAAAHLTDTIGLPSTAYLIVPARRDASGDGAMRWIVRYSAARPGHGGRVVLAEDGTVEGHYQVDESVSGDFAIPASKAEEIAYDYLTGNRGLLGSNLMLRPASVSTVNQERFWTVGFMLRDSSQGGTVMLDMAGGVVHYIGMR